MNCLSKSEVVFLKERDFIYNAKLFYESVVRDFENYDILEQDSIAFLAPKNSKFSIKLKSPSYFSIYLKKDRSQRINRNISTIPKIVHNKKLPGYFLSCFIKLDLDCFYLRLSDTSPHRQQVGLSDLSLKGRVITP